MALFNEGVSVTTHDGSNKEGMDVKIGEGLSAEAQAKLKAMADQRAEEPAIELPSAEDMDLEKPLLPPAEVAPAVPSVSSELAGTALSSTLQPEAEAKSEKQVDHSRHDSSRQHAKDVHDDRPSPSKRNPYAVQRRSEKALDRLVSTYGLNEEEPVAPEPQQAAESAPAAPAEAQAPDERPKPRPPKQAAESIRPIVELKPRQQNISDNHHKDTLQPSQRPAEKPMPRKEFIKQQEELWGANDKIAPEDVPEGEMTYEQYLAQRPKAEEGDYYHENGRIHDAVTGVQVKRAQYEEEKLHEDANKVRDDHYEAVALQQTHEAALEQNEKHDAVMSDIVRDHVEGEVLIRKDPHLQGLYDLGKELQTLYNSKARGKKFEKNVKSPFEAKEAIFNDLFQLYSEKGYDERALGFISDRTHANIEDPEVVPIEDSTFYKGDKVKVVDFVETEAAPGSEAQKTYTIEHDDGLVETVNGDEVEFKRDYNPEKEKMFDRVKNFFKREGRKLREYGGKAYFAGLWTSTAGNWLTNRHITENMTEEEVQAQKLKNRRNNIIGATVGVLAGIVAIKTGIFVGTSLEGGHEALIHTDAGSEHINGVHDLAGHEAAAPIHTEAGSEHVQGVHDTAGHEAAAGPRVEVVPIVGDSSVHTEVINGSSTEALLSNPAYNIPDGGSLDQVFGSVGVNPATWQQHAQELYVQYPNVFYNEGGDIRIANPGWLPEQVRATIESFKG